MNKFRLFFFLVFVITSCYELVSQHDQTKNTTMINYNFQNKLRFEWPVFYSYINEDSYYDRILKTPECTDIILSYLEEIRFEANANQPLDIVLVQMNQTIQMHIYRNVRPVTYHTKDTSLLFHGLHRFRIVSAGDQDMFIYFDQVDDLLLLKKINFIDLHYNLKSRKHVSRYQIVRSTDLFFSDISGELVYTGRLGFQTKRIIMPTVLVGASVGPDRLGISLGTEMSFVNYSVYPYGQTFMRSKYGLGISLFGFDQYQISKTGLFYMQKPVIAVKNNLPMTGIGLGILGASEGPFFKPKESKDIFGMYGSLIFEWDQFRISLDANILLSKIVNEGQWIPYQLSAYYVF